MVRSLCIYTLLLLQSNSVHEIFREAAKKGDNEGQTESFGLLTSSAKMTSDVLRIKRSIFASLMTYLRVVHKKQPHFLLVQNSNISAEMAFYKNKSMFCKTLLCMYISILVHFWCTYLGITFLPMSDFSLSTSSFSAVTFIHTLGISGSIILRETKSTVLCYCIFFVN